MRKILISLVVIGVIGSTAVGLSRAFFNDSETSTGNIFQAGVIDLKVDNTSYYNGVLSEATTWELDDLPGHLFFNFTDLKPDDQGEDTISLHVNDNEAWSCMNINMTKNDDNTCTSPENADDPTCSEPDADLLDGELAQNVNFVFWIDDGDNVLESNEAVENNILAEGSADQIMTGTTWALADSTINKFGGEVGEGLDPQQTYYIGKAWCFGTLTLAPLAQDGVNNAVTPANTTGGIACDGTALNNATQSDIVNADVTFTAIQHRNNPNFQCNPSTPTPTPTVTPTPTATPTPTPTPTPLACTGGNQYAASAPFTSQGTRKNGTAVLADRSVASQMFGAPQTTGTASDAVVPANSFYSLGFKIGQPDNGSVILGFTNPFAPNPAGADVQVYEVTGGVYPDEKILVEVGPTSAGPWTIALPNPGTRDAGFEMSVPSAQFVRLTDKSDINIFEATADAYDVDAVKVCNTVNPQ